MVSYKFCLFIYETLTHIFIYIYINSGPIFAVVNILIAESPISKHI